MRLRISPSEMARLIATGRIEETIHFGPEEDAKLTYAVEHAPQVAAMTVRYRPQEVTVVIPTTDAQQWVGGEQVGVYCNISAGGHTLELAIEKDFACLDKSDAENQDTFPHPRQGATC